MLRNKRLTLRHMAAACYIVTHMPVANTMTKTMSAGINFSQRARYTTNA
jgi:hypothetical protein